MNASWGMLASFFPVLLVASAACGGGESDGVAPGTEQPPAVDSGAKDGGESEAAPSTLGRGFVSVETLAGEATLAVAAFATPDFSGGRKVEADGCLVSGPDDPAPDSAPDVYESAGAIKVAAGSRSALLEYVTADGKGIGYRPAELSGGTSPLSPEVPIRVEAAGATVPAFDLTVLPAEVPEVTTSPAGGVVVGQAFEVSWTSSALDYVTVWLVGNVVNVRCYAEASKGKIVVSSERIAKVAADPTKPLQLTIHAERVKDGRFDGFDVTLVHRAVSKPVALPVN